MYNDRNIFNTTELYIHLKIVKIIDFVMCVFYHNKRKRNEVLIHFYNMGDTGSVVFSERNQSQKAA